MKRLIFSATMAAMSMAASAQNPIIQTQYTSDPAPVVHGDTVYLFVSHDNAIREGYDMTEWLLFTSTDMVNWTDHGAVASLASFGSWASTADNGAWAPQAVERDGKWYMYCPIQLRGVGVLKADSPYGPWKDTRKRALFNYDLRDIDPTVFIDDDGTAYIYWGNNGLWYAKLSTGMTSLISGTKHEVERTTEAFGGYKDDDGNVVGDDCYEEGPWFYKHDGHYYLVYAAGGVPEHLSYSMSDSPTGPWLYKGKIMDTPTGSFTTHPGVIEFCGRQFLFYHSGQLTGGSGFRRSVCVEEFSYNDDGTIPFIKATKTAVAEAVAHLDALARQEAETIAKAYGVKTSRDSVRGMIVDSIGHNGYVKVRSVDFGEAGAKSLTVSVRSMDNPGSMEVTVDGTSVATFAINGLTQWTEITAPLTQTVTGIHDIQFKFKADDTSAATRKNLCQFDYWQFHTTDPTAIRNNSAARKMPKAVYNLQGQRVAEGTPLHGLYIIDGKKVVK